MPKAAREQPARPWRARIEFCSLSYVLFIVIFRYESCPQEAPKAGVTRGLSSHWIQRREPRRDNLFTVSWWNCREVAGVLFHSILDVGVRLEKRGELGVLG
jgi:hypothetical protein